VAPRHLHGRIEILDQPFPPERALRRLRCSTVIGHSLPTPRKRLQTGEALGVRPGGLPVRSSSGMSSDRPRLQSRGRQSTSSDIGMIHEIHGTSPSACSETDWKSIGSAAAAPGEAVGIFGAVYFAKLVAGVAEWSPGSRCRSASAVRSECTEPAPTSPCRDPPVDSLREQLAVVATRTGTHLRNL
jgi:hypothetical protein